MSNEATQPVSALTRTRELAKIVLKTDTIKAVLSRSPQYCTVEMREFVDLLVERFDVSANKLAAVINMPLADLDPKLAMTWKALHQIEVEVRGKEPAAPVNHMIEIKALAPSVLKHRTILNLLDGRQSLVPESPGFKFAVALEHEFGKTSAELRTLLITTSREPWAQAIVDALVQIERDARKEPPSNLSRAIASEAHKYLMYRTIHDLLDAHLAGELEGPVSDFMHALCKDLGKSPLELIKALELESDKRTELQTAIVKRLVNLQSDARGYAREVDSSEFKESTVPSFLLKGMSIREAIIQRNAPGLSSEIMNFVDDTLKELGIDQSQFIETILNPLTSPTHEQMDLRDKFHAIEKRWNDAIAQLDRAEVKEAIVPTAFHLNELQHAKIEAAYWRREAMRGKYAPVLRAATEAQKELTQADDEFEILASSMSINTAWDFSWDTAGVVSYGDKIVRPKKSIRPKGR